MNSFRGVCCNSWWEVDKKRKSKCCTIEGSFILVWSFVFKAWEAIYEAVKRPRALLKNFEGQFMAVKINRREAIGFFKSKAESRNLEGCETGETFRLGGFGF